MASLYERLERLALLSLVITALALAGCKTIPEGKSSVNEIQIRGADKLSEGDIEDKIATSETSKFLFLFRGILFEYSLFDRFVLQRDLARVEAFYHSKGFYDVHARAGRVHRIDDKHVRVEIIVEEGATVMVREVHVDGLEGVPKPIADVARQAAADGLLVNKPFEEETFTKTEGLVRRALSDRGYAYAKVKADAAVDIVNHKTDIVLTVHPGPVCTFGDITIEGLGQLPEKNIRRTLDIKKGSPYSEQQLDDAQQALLDLGVLAGVEIAPVGVKPNPDVKKDGNGDEKPKDEGGENGGKPEEKGPSPGSQGPVDGPPVVDLHVKLEPARLKTIRIGGGLEFDSLKSDVHGLIGWENRNFFGGLRTFSVDFRPGIVLYPTRVNNLVAPTNFLPQERLRFEFKQPGFLEARTNFFDRPEFNIYPLLINPDPPPGAAVIGYGEFRNAIGLERALWKFYAALSHHTQVDYPFGYLGGGDPTLGLVVLSYPELFTSLDFRDDKLHTHKGIYLANTLQVAGGVFGGSANDVKIQPEARFFLPVTKKIVWASRVSMGAMSAKNYGTYSQTGPYGAANVAFKSEERTKDYQLTYFRGFFSGGPSSNRGYTVFGVGPYDVVPFLTPDIAAQNVDAECGSKCRSPTGGFSLWEASTEVRFTINGPLSVATFCDASDVSPRELDYQLKNLHLSCGLGARYDTPAGPIRLDIGYRIPGLQTTRRLDDQVTRNPVTRQFTTVLAEERDPATFVGGIPIAVSIGIGEAY